MSVEEIHQAFQDAVAKHVLTTDAPPPGLAGLLDALGVRSLEVRDGTVSLGPRSVLLTATTTYLDTPWAMRLTGTPQAGAARAALVLELGSAAVAGTWTFQAAFGTLPGSRCPVAGGNGGLVVGPGVLGPLVLDQPAVTATNEPAGARPRLSGTLLMRGSDAVSGSDVLATYADFLGDRLHVEGPLAFPVGAPPVIELRAVAPGVRLELAGLAVSTVGLMLTTDYPDPYPLPEEGARRSAVLLFADVALVTDPGETATVSGPLLTGDYIWPLAVALDPPLGLERGIQALIAMTGGSGRDFTLPSGIAAIDRFRLQDLGFGIVPIAFGGPGVSYAEVGIVSNEPWDPPVPYLTFDQVGTRWVFGFSPSSPALVTGVVFGTMRFGRKTGSSLGSQASFADRAECGTLPRTGFEDIVVTVRLSLPDLAFSAFTEAPFALPVSEVFRVFFGGDGPSVDADLTCDSLNIDASLPRKELAAGLTVSGNWPIRAGNVTLALTGLQLQVRVSQSQVSGALIGKGEIAVPESDPIELFARARYPGTGDWEIGAVMSGAVDLPRLVHGLTGQQPPDWVNELTIELAGLSVRFSTADGTPYAAAGTLRMTVAQELLGMAFQLLLTADIERRPRTAPPEERLAIALRDTALVEPLTVLTGSLSGSFTINKLEVTASVSVTDAGKDYTFTISYREVSLSAVTSWAGEGADRHQLLTIRLTGTLGELLTYLVSLVNPNATFRLDPPWTFLDSVDLTGLELTVDPTGQTVTVTHDIKLDLGFVTITSIGLNYDRSTGRPAVSVVLDARLLGDTTAKPLSWDPITQAPPQPPGLGQRLFSLRYAGLGQHVSPKDLGRYTGIADAVDAMVAAMRPADPASGKPPLDPATMVFDAAGQWLFGIDATFMGTVALKLVMHDPDLYGVLLALSGPRAGSLAGLSVELLYQKVTDDIGVFHARLQIPDAYRQLRFGAVSVTLGVITVDVYTNGNFRIDLGFPTGGDFTDSFAMEAGLFNGRGGIYFGVLNGATSSRVPRITDGTFSPVLELGVGLSIGVGRTFQRGPLKAEMYVNLVVVFEGVLAWFHPDDDGRSSGLYYACRGTVGIVGRLYGTVDFKVIRVELNLRIAAMATVELTAHRATAVALNLSVRASAKVKILFVTVSFSFSLTLETSFLIGSDSVPPWRLAPGAARRRLTAPSTLAAPASAEQPPYRLRFDPDAHVFPDGRPRTVHLALVPAYTIANVPVDRTGQTPPPSNGSPDYRLVVMLFADNAVPADAATIARAAVPDVSRNPRAATAADTSFNRLADGLLRWSLNALDTISPTVTLDELTCLVEQLAMPEAEGDGFTWANIQGFLAHNIHLRISGTPNGDPPDDVSGTPFPMIPVLKWTATGLPDPADEDRDFATYRQIDATYETEAIAYFAELDPAPPGDRRSASAAPDEPGASMATFVLRDYLRMVARATAQAAVNLLTAFPHEVTEGDSLHSIAAGFGTSTTRYEVASRDTADHAASRLGVSAAELLALNPGLPDRLSAARAGDTLTVTLGVTPQSIALANPDWPVVADTPVTLGTLPVRIGAGQSLGQLAHAYRADSTALLGHLRDSAPLLRAGATVPLPGFIHAGLSVDDTAAVFHVRLGQTLPDEVPLAPWYQQAIDRLNDSPGQPLPPALQVPDGYQSTATTTWTTLPGDTVLDVAAYAALIQNVVPGTPFADWLEAVRTANGPAAPDGVRLPADAAAVVLPNDTLRSLQDRLLLPAERFDPYAAAADALVPLVTVEVPGALGTTTPGLTLLTLAQKYGLGLDDLAARIAHDTGVLAARREPPLAVPDVPAMALDELVTALHDGPAMATVSGQVARFMLGGLRLPAPVRVDGTYHAVGPMTGGYELIGQQVTGPRPPAETDGPVVTVTVEKSVPADWLTFAEAVVEDGVIRPDAAEAGNAVVSITSADLRVNYPATVLVPVVESPLAPLSPAHEIGTRHAVPQAIPWRTTTAVRLPAEPSGPPSLWPLPSDLIAHAGPGRSDSEFLLEQTTPQTGADARYTELGSYAWATLVSFTVRGIPGLAGTVEVLGADDADRQRIAQILEYLRAVPEKPATGAFPPAPPGESLLLTLLWQLPPSPGITPGLTSTPLAADRTFIVQTNLSTETASNPTSRNATAGQHFAAIADCERFLTLLWECGLVGGGGYWMRYPGEVPGSILDQDGLARLSLLVQLSSQCGAEPDRHLYAFTDVAVVGDGVDPATVALAARAVSPPELRPVASVDPGQVGFTARFANPAAEDTPQGRLRGLYGLLGFQLDPTRGFRGSVEGRAVSPKPADGTDELGLLVPSEAAEAVWDLTRTVDISRFALQRAKAVPTAPSPQGDPYSGIAAGARSQVSVWFVDVFGNRSGTAGQTAVPVRYTDPVVGVGAWPSTTLRYGVAPAGELAELTVAVDLQAIAYQPGAAEAGGSAAAAAQRDRDRLVPVHHQVCQADVRAALLTSLQQRPGSDPTPLTVDVDVLRRYVTGAHALLASLAETGPAPATGATTLDTVCTTYGVGFDELGAANAGTAVSAMLDTGELAVPVGAAFRNGDTIAGLCHTVDPSLDPEQVLLDQDNTVLPINPAVELVTPPRETAVPPGSPPADELAAALRCSLRTLVTANQDRPGLLTPGFVFGCAGARVQVAFDRPASEATPAGVAFAFQELGVPFDATQVVSLNADKPGMFRADASLLVTGYLVESGDTLRDNRAGLTPEQLAPLNTTTVDLFAPGAPVFLTTTPTPVPTGNTLGHFATVSGTTPGALLRHNGSVPLATDSPPAVPGMWAWPADPDALRVPYTVREGDSLDGIAAHFPGADLVEVNAEMPRTIAPDVTITVDDESVTTTAPASFAEVCALFGPPVDPAAFRAAIGDRTDVLLPGALLVCPPGELLGPPAVAGVTPRAAARLFGVTALALVAANVGTPGLLLPGQVLRARPPGANGTVPTETTAACDTLTAVVERFRRRGVVTGVDAVVTANADVRFLRAGARVVVPPATARLTGQLGELTPDGTLWSFPEPVFPVTVRLELSRDPALVAPELAATATRDATAVPADRSTDPAQDGALTLAAFAERVQRAVPALRLATAPARTADTDLWAVVFDGDGIESVTVRPPCEIAGTGQPRVFALRPLSTTLMARRHVNTPGFDVRTGLLTGGQVRDYQGIDVEVWARSFLADVELLLSAAYVQGAYALGRDDLDAVIGVKKTLAGAVAEGLDHILAGQAPGGADPKRAAAVERLRQELLVSLTRGYATSAVLQYDTSASSPWPGPYARLSGNPVVGYDSVPEHLRTATVSNGRIPLADGDSQVSFLLTVPDVAAHAALDISLDFAGVQLEFGIARETEGYERSDRLTFVTPLEPGSPPALDFDLGAPRVPIPLRAYPPMPILLDHDAVVPPHAARLDDVLHWQYRCAVRHQSAEQDTIELQVTYNQPPPTPAAAPADDLFTALARYTAVSAPLLGLLAGLPDWERAEAGRRTVLANALGTYRTLASAVAEAWDLHWAGHASGAEPALATTAGGGPAPAVHRHRYELGLDAQDGWYTTLRLSRTTVEPGPGEAGRPTRIVCVTTGGERHELTPVGPARGGCADTDHCWCYLFPPQTVEAFTLLTFELTFPPVHIAACQNASATARVTRNARLLGENWPDTASDFVYRTPEVGYSEPVVPFIDITGALAIGPWGPPDHNPLTRMFDAVFDGDPAGRTIAIGARYEYVLVAGDPPVSALLPVLQSTVGTYDAETVPRLTRVLDEWCERERPGTEGGAWAFRVGLYSSVDAALRRPVLQLRHVSSAQSASSGPPCRG